MKLFWNEEKNTLLKQTRNVSFDDIKNHIDGNGTYILEAHPNQKLYPHQYVLCIEKDNYILVVPCVSHEEGYFLKTIYPSRRMTKKHIS